MISENNVRQIRQTRIFPNCPYEQAHIAIISTEELTMNDVRIPISIMEKKNIHATKKTQVLSERKLSQRKGVRAQFL